MADLHIRPTDDLTDHDTLGDDCVCIPKQVPVEHEDGSLTWIAVHHSLDGRELSEPDPNSGGVAAYLTDCYSPSPEES